LTDTLFLIKQEPFLLFSFKQKPFLFQNGFRIRRKVVRIELGMSLKWKLYST